MFLLPAETLDLKSFLAFFKERQNHLFLTLSDRQNKLRIFMDSRWVAFLKVSENVLE